jgi:hypothetical protein
MLMQPMTFEEQLRRTFAAAADEALRELTSAADALIERSRAERAAAEERSAREAREVAVEEMSARLRLSVEEAVAQARAAQRIDDLEQAAADHHAADRARGHQLLAAVRAIDRSRSLSEILLTLSSVVAGEARRVAIFLVRGGELRGWQFAGFGPDLDGAHDLGVTTEPGILADVVRSGEAAVRTVSPAVPSPTFAQLPAGRDLMAVPLPVSGQVVAVLYADQGASGDAPHASWAAVVEVLARHAARTLEVLTAYRVAQVSSERRVVAIRGG